MNKDGKVVNRQDILKELIKLNHNINASKIDKVLDTVFDELSVALTCGDKIEIRGFGSLIVRKRKGGEARNPKNGKLVQTVDRGFLYFRASRELIKLINRASSNDNEKAKTKVRL